MGEHKKKQHYVPKFYLRNFANLKEQVFVLKIDNKKIFQRNINEVCVRNNLYETKWNEKTEKLGEYILDNHIENDFSELESDMSKLLKILNEKIDNGFIEINLCDEEKDKLFEYIATQYLRVPYVIDDTLEFYNGVEDDLRMKNISETMNDIFAKMNIENNLDCFMQHSKKWEYL